MSKLVNVFNKAKDNNIPFVAIVVRMGGFPKDEIIINENENIDSKLAYYQKTYDDNLNHKFAPGIRIVDVVCGSSFEYLQAYLNL